MKAGWWVLAVLLFGCSSGSGSSSGGGGGAGTGGGAAGGGAPSGGEQLAKLDGFTNSGQAPFGIDVDDTHVYVSVFDAAEDRGVLRLPKSGGTPEVVASEGESSELVVHQGTVFFETPKAIHRVPVTGGTPEAIWEESGATELTVAGDVLYYANAIVGSPNSTVGAIPLAGGASVELLRSDERPVDVEVAGDQVYVALLGPGSTASAKGSIVRVPAAGGPATVIASSLAGARNLVVDGDILYATVQGIDDNSGRVIAITLSTGAASTLVDGLNKPWGLVADATHLYWVSVGGARKNEGAIMKLPKSGGTASVLASGQGEPRQLVLDETHVYWANFGTGEVQRVAK